MNEGYTVRHIPAQEYKVCHGCKWLNSGMLHSGRNPTYNYSCRHPNNDPNNFFNLTPLGRFIYYNHEGDCITPDWCPYLKDKVGDDVT